MAIFNKADDLEFSVEHIVAPCAKRVEVGGKLNQVEFFVEIPKGTHHADWIELENTLNQMAKVIRPADNFLTKVDWCPTPSKIRTMTKKRDELNTLADKADELIQKLTKDMKEHGGSKDCLWEYPLGSATRP